MDNRHILVVEDEPKLLKAIEAKLKRGGFSVTTARSADQAIGYLEDPDLTFNALWLDHYLEGEKSGIDVAEHAKASENYKDMPIFVVSNTASADKVTQYKEMLVTKYLVKSDERLDGIVETVEAYLEGKV